MFKKKKTYAILIIIIAIIGSVFYFKNKKVVTQYTTSDAIRGNLIQTVSVTGKTVSPTQVDLSFKYSGRVTSLNVDVGDHVTKGEKIATIDPGTLYSQLKQAKENVKVQRKTLTNMKNRRSTYTFAQIAAQEAQVESIEATVSQVSDQIRELVLYSPMNGIIIRKNVNVGEVTVANAVTENTSVVTIASEGDLEIQADVPESDITKVSIGQAASVTLDAFTPDDVFNVHVYNIEPASTIIQDVVYYKVKFNFDSQDARVRNGMTANVDIHTDEKDNVVYVPQRAIKTENGGKYVEVLKDEKNNITERKTVTTGMAGDDGMVEIKSGLSGGEKVVTLAKTP